MKKLFLISTLILMPMIAVAQEASLSPSVSLSVPTATKLQLIGRYENFIDQTMVVYFRWLDSNGNPIYAAGTNGKFDNSWVCSGQCFTDIYGFVIRQQDVGTTLGKGTRALVINKMKVDLPQLSGVSVTFGD